MITWISRAALVGATCVALTACGIIADVGVGVGVGIGEEQDIGLPGATLARGAVNLVAPEGYCVDKRSVRARFALMARCDTLGGSAPFGVPLAIITAATVDQGTNSTSGNTDDETILSRQSSGGITLLEVNGTPPSPDMRSVFWRAIGEAGGQVIGLAIYEGQNGSLLGERAPQLLIETMERTRARSGVQISATQDNSATTPAKP